MTHALKTKGRDLTLQNLPYRTFPNWIDLERLFTEHVPESNVNPARVVRCLVSTRLLFLKEYAGHVGILK